jgi:hypothetical protein
VEYAKEHNSQIRIRIRLCRRRTASNQLDEENQKLVTHIYIQIDPLFQSKNEESGMYCLRDDIKPMSATQIALLALIRSREIN